MNLPLSNSELSILKNIASGIPSFEAMAGIRGDEKICLKYSGLTPAVL
jgi:hypothetical protein